MIPGMKKVQFEVDYTAEDYLQANLLHAKRQNWMYAISGTLLLILGLAMIPTYKYFALVPLFFGFHTLAYRFIYLRYYVNKAFSGLDLNTRNYFVIDDTGVENKYGNGQSKHTWNEITDIRHDKNMLMLYIAKYKFFMVPKRAVEQSDWNELVTVENARVKNGA